jgi:hypothetical protein
MQVWKYEAPGGERVLSSSPAMDSEGVLYVGTAPALGADGKTVGRAGGALVAVDGNIGPSKEVRVCACVSLHCLWRPVPAVPRMRPHAMPVNVHSRFVSPFAHM